MEALLSVWEAVLAATTGGAVAAAVVSPTASGQRRGTKRSRGEGRVVAFGDSTDSSVSEPECAAPKQKQ